MNSKKSKKQLEDLVSDAKTYVSVLESHISSEKYELAKLLAKRTAALILEIPDQIDDFKRREKNENFEKVVQEDKNKKNRR